MDKQYADYLIKKTKEDYDKIAGDFSRTRAYLWDDLRQFASRAKGGDSLLDFGCGNGRLFELFGDIKNVHYIGIDQSCALIERAKEKYAGAEFIYSDSAKLPFPNEHFNMIFAVASLHHIPSEQKRLAQTFLPFPVSRTTVRFLALTSIHTEILLNDWGRIVLLALGVYLY